MGDDVTCDYVEPDELDDDDTFKLMVEAFAAGIIAPADRAPMLRQLDGKADLVFVLSGGGRGEPVAAQVAHAITVRLSPEVQRRLVAHFAHWLAAN